MTYAIRNGYGFLTKSFDLIFQVAQVVVIQVMRTMMMTLSIVLNVNVIAPKVLTMVPMNQ